MSVITNTDKNGRNLKKHISFGTDC